jgi:outer membrane immunogenic protein
VTLNTDRRLVAVESYGLEHTEFPMKRLLVAGIAVASFCGASALAADLPTKAPAYVPAPAPMFSWSGWYIGANGGYAWGGSNGQIPYSDTAGITALTQGFSDSGWFGGGQIGFNQQNGHSVWGLEADIQGSDIKDNFSVVVPNAPAGISGNQKIDYFGTVRGRIGLAYDRTLLYATGGWAYGSVKDNFVINAFPASNSATKGGWVVGAGIEYAFAPNWSMKLEYQYINLGNTTFTEFVSPAPITAHSVSADFSTVRVGLNWKFGDPWGKAPVVSAKY